MPRLRNTYSVDNFIALTSNVGLNAKSSIEQVLEAYGQSREELGGAWCGGFLVKMQKSSGGNPLAHIYVDIGGATRMDSSTHVLDFPNLPENTDKDPFTLNEFIDGDN